MMAFEFYNSGSGVVKIVIDLLLLQCSITVSYDIFSHSTPLKQLTLMLLSNNG